MSHKQETSPCPNPSPARIPVVKGRIVHRMIEDPQGRMQQVQMNLGESPLSWLKARGLISKRLYLAGDRLREDWERAGLGPHVTMQWDGAAPSRQKSGGSAPFFPAEHQMAAKRRFDEALSQCGPGLSDIAWRVICAGEGLSAAEKAMGWPTRAAKLVLGFALERLARYYHIA